MLRIKDRKFPILNSQFLIFYLTIFIEQMTTLNFLFRLKCVQQT
ncbi:Uncharacterized protein dnm_071480 [Desulfonema magnum]|uniref:Uncharacterized protein n=1 Tax=Desulfonema magnum TaxID=45655 RepID=A0A975BTE4_9BACT|nr:Uncharacterized protein dnm_071480 [Desulfonema magnum]